MPRVRDHEETGGRNLALHEHVRVETRLVLVTGHDQRRHLEPLELPLELEDRGPRHLHAPHRQRVAARGAGDELVVELLPAPRVLPQELHASRPLRVELGDACHAALLELADDVLHLPVEGLAVGAAAIAAAGDRQGQRALGIQEPEVERRVAAHREADDVRLRDPEVVEDAPDVVRGPALGVRGRVFRNVGGRVAPRVVRERAVASAEERQLQAPARRVSRELVDEDERRPGAGLLVEEAEPVVGQRVRHRVTRATRS